MLIYGNAYMYIKLDQQEMKKKQVKGKKTENSEKKFLDSLYLNKDG